MIQSSPMTNALLIFSILSFSLTVWAADPSTAASARQYPGGADEQDLKVQPQLTPPTAKIDRRTMDQRVLQNFLRKTGQTPSNAKAPANQKAKPKQ